VAVRTVVRAQRVQQCAAVRLVVYGSARGSVRLCGSRCSSVWHCGSVWQCGSVRQCKPQCVAVRTV
jgi:hypothetical protein